MEDDDGNTHLKGLSMHPASTEEEALNLLFLVGHVCELVVERGVTKVPVFRAIPTVPSARRQ